jgi:hypothetical protein
MIKKRGRPMSRKTTGEKITQMNNFTQLISELGYEPVSSDIDCVIAEGRVVHIWCDFSRDCMYFARVEQFDRWANSRDYVFYGIPKNRDDLEIVLRIAVDCTKQKICRDDTFQPVDLNQWWRKYKNLVKRERQAIAM